jgi:hypothetical protein
MVITGQQQLQWQLGNDRSINQNGGIQSINCNGALGQQGQLQLQWQWGTRSVDCVLYRSAKPRNRATETAAIICNGATAMGQQEQLQ